MIYLFIFLGLLIAIIGLLIATAIVKKIAKRKGEEKNGRS